MMVPTNGSLPTEDGSVNTVKSTELTVDQKIDKLMEAVLMLQQLNIMSLKAMDKLLSKPDSKLIKF